MRSSITVLNTAARATLPVVAAAPAEPAMPGAGWRAYAPMVAVAVLVSAVLFNPVLAIVNGHLHPLTGGTVAAIQAALVVAALGCGLATRPLPLAWLLLAWLLFLSFLVLAVVRGQVVPKDLGDVLLIPAFICLGTQLGEKAVIRTTCWLQAVVAVVGAWELLSPAGFGAVFKVLDYYVSTRGFSKQDFWAGGELFVSSVRGGGRMLLPWTGFHRGSSIFLEPVSLGNWAVVVSLVLAVYWDRLSVFRRALLAASIAWVLFVCDGRLAIGVCLILAGWAPFARRFDARLAVLYPPLMIVLLAVLDAVGALPDSGDTLTGRFHGGITLLGSLSPAQLMGVGDLSKAAVDAGWVYMVETQSVVTATALWLVLMLYPAGRDPAGRVTRHGIGLFIALCLPITYAILSIKTSGLMWAVYGQAYQSFRVRDAALGARDGAPTK